MMSSHRHSKKACLTRCLAAARRAPGWRRLSSRMVTSWSRRGSQCRLSTGESANLLGEDVNLKLRQRLSTALHAWTSYLALRRRVDQGLAYPYRNGSTCAANHLRTNFPSTIPAKLSVTLVVYSFVSCSAENFACIISGIISGKK